MTNKGIWAGLVAIAFVAGSIMTGTMAYAASNAQGQPFQQLQQQLDDVQNNVDSFFDVFTGGHTIDSFFDIFTETGQAAPDSFFDIFVDIHDTDANLQRQIDNLGSSGNDFTVDSFFDVFYDIDLSSSSCPEGQVPKIDQDLQATTCIPESSLAPDSFFDVFYDIQLDTQQNTDDIGTIDTELVALELHSTDSAIHLRQDCEIGQVLKWDATLGWVCAEDNSGSGTASDVVCDGCVDSADIADGTITSADIADGTITSADLGDSGCADGEVLKWDDGTTTWNCAADLDTQYSGADFALSNQVCTAGQKVTGIDSSGNISCEPDNVGIVTETDPQVGSTTNGQWCRGTGTQVTCDVTPVGGSGSIGRLQVIERSDPTPVVLGGGGATGSSFAPCLSGEIVVGGGYRSTLNVINIFSESSVFAEGAFGWLVGAYYDSGTTPATVTAIAYCATIVP